MKRFITVVSRLLFVVAVAAAVAFILLGILVMRVEDMATQVAALSTRVHELEQAAAVSVAPSDPYFIVNSAWVNWPLPNTPPLSQQLLCG